MEGTTGPVGLLESRDSSDGSVGRSFASEHEVRGLNSRLRCFQVVLGTNSRRATQIATPLQKTRGGGHGARRGSTQDWSCTPPGTPATNGYQVPAKDRCHSPTRVTGIRVYPAGKAGTRRETSGYPLRYYPSTWYLLRVPVRLSRRFALLKRRLHSVSGTN